MTAATYSHEHLVRDLTARILDRLASQDSRATEALEALGLTHEDRLSVGAGLVLVGNQAEPASVGRESLGLIAEQFGRPIKENPPASAIAAGDLVLLSIGMEEASTGGKALLTRLEKQLQALGRSGAMAVVAFDQFNAWPQAVRQKAAAVLQKHPCPRLFCFFGHDPKHPQPSRLPLLDSCKEGDVGVEAPACRRRIGM